MKKNIYLAIAVLLLVGMFFLLSSKKQSLGQNPSVSSAASVSTNSAQQKDNVKTFNLVIKNRKLSAGPETIQVTQGDKVELNITSDEDSELHLHGYDKSVDLKKDKTVTLTFTANITGRFNYEMEDFKAEIGAIEVLPK